MATPVIRVRFSTDHMARLYNKASQSKNCKAAPNVSKVQITDMLLLTTSFLGYPLPRSHRHGGFEKKNVSIHKLFLCFAWPGLQPLGGFPSWVGLVCNLPLARHPFIGRLCPNLRHLILTRPTSTALQITDADVLACQT